MQNLAYSTNTTESVERGVNKQSLSRERLGWKAMMKNC